MPTYNEGNYISDVVKMEQPQYYCRDVATIKSGADLDLGTVLGRSLAGAVTVGAAEADEGNTGNGTVTLGNPAYGPQVKEGVYTLICVAAATDSGTFELRDPQGDVVAAAIKVGTAENGSHLKLTINDGATDFAVGDKFTIAVAIAEGSLKYKAIDFEASDGSDIAMGILLQNAAAADADVPDALVLVRGPAIVASNKLIWPEGATDAQKANAIAQLAALGIKVQQGA